VAKVRQPLIIHLDTSPLHDLRCAYREVVLTGEDLSLGDLELEQTLVSHPGGKLVQGKNDILWWAHKVCLICLLCSPRVCPFPRLRSKSLSFNPRKALTIKKKKMIGIQ
jgi:hypothetical protein